MSMEHHPRHLKVETLHTKNVEESSVNAPINPVVSSCDSQKHNGPCIFFMGTCVMSAIPPFSLSFPHEGRGQVY